MEDELRINRATEKISTAYSQLLGLEKFIDHDYLLRHMVESITGNVLDSLLELTARDREQAFGTREHDFKEGEQINGN